MATRKYANNFGTTLNGAITNVQTTITLTSATGLPAIGAGEEYNLTITDGTNIEIVTVTDDASSPTLTVTRGVDGTSGTAFANGDTVELRLDSLSFEDVLSADTSPQLRGDLDTNANNIIIDNTKGINDENSNEQLVFSTTASAVNHLQVTNAATGNDPDLAAVGGDTNIGITVTPKGTGNFTAGTMVFDADQTIGVGQDNYVLTYDNATGLISLEASGGGGASAFTDLTDITTSTTDTADDTESFNDVRYLKSGDPVITNAGVSLIGSSATTKQYTWSTGAYPRMIGNVTSDYIGFDGSGYPIMANGSVTAYVDTTTFSVTGGTIYPIAGVLMGAGASNGILDSSGNEFLMFNKGTSAVNYWTIDNKATGVAPVLRANGSDTNIDASIQPKGTGDVILGNYTLDGDQTVGAGTDNYVMTYDNGTGLISLEAAAGGGGTSPGFSAVASSAQTISNSTTTKLQFQTEVFDSDSDYDNTTNYRFTPSVSGDYFVQASATLSGMGDQKGFAMYIYKNGAQAVLRQINNSAATTSTPGNYVIGVINCNGSTDYIEIYINQTNGTSLDTIASGTTFTAFKIN